MAGRAKTPTATQSALSPIFALAFSLYVPACWPFSEEPSEEALAEDPLSEELSEEPLPEENLPEELSTEGLPSEELVSEEPLPGEIPGEW